MFAYRWTYRIKFGRMPEAVKLCEEAIATIWKPMNVVVRLYTTNIGPGQALAFEMEAENEEQQSGFWKRYEAEYAKLRATKTLVAKFNATVDRLVASERWTLRR